jgi:hypothetical protein
MTLSNFSQNGNGNGNGAINGKGIKRRALTHNELIDLAADAVAGVHPVVPSLEQVPAIFSGITRAEVRERLNFREACRKAEEEEATLFAFADAWREQSLAWRMNGLRWISTRSDLSDIQFALKAATSS